MKANKFVKKFGWGGAKHALNIACNKLEHVNYKNHAISISDLKRLVESRELVREHGSIERAKDYAQSPYTAPEVSERLNQAIADVESCL